SSDLSRSNRRCYQRYRCASESHGGTRSKTSDARSHENAVQYLRANCRAHREATGDLRATRRSERASGDDRTVSSGQLRKHEQFRSRFLRNQRDLIVYTPPGYADRSRRHFPVLYLHDGQNLFDGVTSFIPGQDWHVGQTADQYIQAGVVAPLIIVGMYNTKARIREYTPTQVPKLGGGRADRYAKFLIEEVKPFVDREYCTLSGSQHTGIGGSSLRGLVSLYLGLHHSCIFGKIAALSPSVVQN